MSGDGRRAGEDFRARLRGSVYFRRSRRGGEGGGSKLSFSTVAVVTRAPLQSPLPIITYSLIRARRKRCTHLSASPSTLARVYPLSLSLSLSLSLCLRRYISRPDRRRVTRMRFALSRSTSRARVSREIGVSSERGRGRGIPDDLKLEKSADRSGDPILYLRRGGARYVA